MKEHQKEHEAAHGGVLMMCVCVAVMLLVALSLFWT